jgi:hypothetical protein
MECTADCHHPVATPGFPSPNGLFEPAAAVDAAVDMCDAYAPSSDLPMTRFLGAREHVSPWLLHRLNELYAVPRERLKAGVLHQLTPGWPWRGCAVGETLVMPTARMGLTQAQHPPGGIDQPEVLEHVPLLLAAITRVLCSRVVGARDGALGAIMTTRGTTAGVAGWPSPTGDGAGGRCGHSTPRGSHNAATRRQGASPKARRVLRHTGHQT